MHPHDQQMLAYFLVAIAVIAVLYQRRWRPSTTSFGTACWATEQCVKIAEMLGNVGIILGRTMSGKLIRVASYCHVLLVGATGSGKGVSIIIPNLLTYFRGSVIVFDCKGDLYATVGKRRAREGAAPHPTCSI